MKAITILILSCALMASCSVFKPKKVYFEDAAVSEYAVHGDSVHVLVELLGPHESRYYFNKNLINESIQPYLVSISNKSECSIEVHADRVDNYITSEKVYQKVEKSTEGAWISGIVGALATPLLLASESDMDGETNEYLNASKYVFSSIAWGLYTLIRVGTVNENNDKKREFIEKISRDKIIIGPGKDEAFIFFTSIEYPVPQKQKKIINEDNLFVKVEEDSDPYEEEGGLIELEIDKSNGREMLFQCWPVYRE